MRILMTGCSSGLGKSLKTFCEKWGYEVFGVGLGGPHVKWDFSDGMSDLWAGRLFMDHGPFDVLINNAGFSYIDMIEKHGADEFENILRINLMVPYALTRAFVLSSPKDGQFRKIINTGSMGAIQGMTGSQGYCASKAGLEAMARCLSREFAAQKMPFGIYTVAPGVIADTKLREYVIEKLVSARGFTREKAEQYFQNSSPHGHPASHEEACRIFKYIIEDATKFESGAVYRAPGGAGI